MAGIKGMEWSNRKSEDERTQFDLISFYIPHRIKKLVIEEFQNICRERPATKELSKTNYKNRIKSIVMRAIFLSFIYNNTKNIEVKKAILSFKKEEEDFIKSIVDKYNSRNE